MGILVAAIVVATIIKRVLRGYMVEKVKRTRKKKEVKEKENETKNLPVKVEEPESKQEIQVAQAEKKPVRKTNPSRSHSSVAEVLVNTFQKLLKKSLLLLVPWVLLSMGVLLTGSYLIYKEFFLGMAYPLWFLILIGVLLFGGYGFLGFCYGLTMALLHTILSVSSSLSDTVKKTALRVKNSIESKVDKFADTLEQNNLLGTIKRTFEDISQNIRRYAAKTAIGVVVIACLGGLLFVMKNIAIKSFNRVQNKAEFFTKMSIRFSLLIAIILNLKLCAKIALAVGYLLGILLILSQFIIWHVM